MRETARNYEHVTPGNRVISKARPMQTAAREHNHQFDEIVRVQLETGLAKMVGPHIHAVTDVETGHFGTVMPNHGDIVPVTLPIPG